MYRPFYLFIVCWMGCVFCSVLEAQILNRPIPAVPANQLPRSYSQPTVTSPVNAALLRNKPSNKYFLDEGDVLGIFIEGVLGNIDESPPVQIPGPNSNLPPSLGFPIPVREDGTISLPLVDPISVRGLTIIQVEDLIKSRYIDRDRPILTPRNRILVSLMRKRTVNVYVIRGDESQSAGLSRARNGVVNQRSDQSRRSNRLQLPAGDNDLLNALSQTGGLPGVNARSDVKIYRSNPTAGRYQPNGMYAAGRGSFPRTAAGGTSYLSSNQYRPPSSYSSNGTRVTTVPTRQRYGTKRLHSSN